MIRFLKMICLARRPDRLLFWLAVVSLTSLLLAACSENAPITPIGVTLTPTLLPTPTLVPVLAGDPAGSSDLPGADARPTDPPATATPPPTSTPAPPPHELLPLAHRSAELRDSALAAAQYRAVLESPDLRPAQREEALLSLGRTEMDNDNPAAAAAAFEEYLDVAREPDSRVHFWLAEVSRETPDAIHHYRAYLEANPDMAAYVQPRLAALEPAQAETALRAALEGGAHYLVHFQIRRQLAEMYNRQQRYAETIEQYAAMRDLARTENTRGELTYLIGQTYEISGDLPSAYQAYQFGLHTYPTAYQSYQGLIALVNAGQPVDPYQRGLVDYYAKAYAPGITAFQEVITSGRPYRPDTHLFLAWCYEGMGDFNQALAQIDQFLRLNPQDPETIGRHIEEKAALLTRSVSVSTAIETLQGFLSRHPEHPKAPWAAYRAGVLADRFLVEPARAIPLYESFVTAYPEDPNAGEAYLRIGMLQFGQNALPEAQAAWEQAAALPGESGRSALIWLIRTAEPEAAAHYRQQAATSSGTDYYSLRARDIGLDIPPYAPTPAIDLAFDEIAGRRAVEEWIHAHFGLTAEAAVSSDLDPALAADPRLVRGEKLWRLGLLTAAKQELEAVREQYAFNAQLSYQLALYFRDLRLYRSSILAADAVINRARVSVFDAPPLIGRLAYPTYFSDVILLLADQYDYDPLLQFALIRQESLYESFIASSAAPQGLIQVIPDTGRYIATRLQWDDYETEDLLRPYLNLQFGAYYLDQQLDLFDGEVAPALAAYNAGPGNAVKWHEVAGSDHDLYLETVNFAETRLYIRRIYIGQAVYRYLYGSEEN